MGFLAESFGVLSLFIRNPRSSVGRVLAYFACSPEFIPQKNTNWVWYGMSAIPALRRKRQRDQSVQRHPWLHSEFETSLGYMEASRLTAGSPGPPV